MTTDIEDLDVVLAESPDLPVWTAVLAEHPHAREIVLGDADAGDR